MTTDQATVQLDVFGRTEAALKRRSDYIDASAARRDHVSTLLANGLTAEQRLAVLRFVATGCLHEWGPTPNHDLVDTVMALDAMYPDDACEHIDNGRSDVVEQAVVDHIAQREDPVEVLLVLLWASHDNHLLNTHWYLSQLRPQDRTGTWAWLHLFGGPLAYEWTAWEAAQLDRLHTELEPPAEASASAALADMPEAGQSKRPSTVPAAVQR